MVNHKTHRREYNSWLGMRHRCRTENHPYYYLYGARGITVCDDWYNSFQKFYADMGDRPLGDFTLDRIDNSEGYFKGNCQWSDRPTQLANRRLISTCPTKPSYVPKNPRKSFTWNGENKLISEWLECTGTSVDDFNARKRKGYSIAISLGLRP